MVSHGINYVRFGDDIIVFAESETDARKHLYEIADILDKQQRLILNREKTQIVTADALRSRCQQMMEDRPINDLEEAVLSVIRKYSGGNPYQTVLLSQLSGEDTLRFTSATLERILNEYLTKRPIDFVRLRWFLGRLTQVGHPGAIEFCLKNLDRMTPAIADACHYLLAASNNKPDDAGGIGSKLIAALKNELIVTNEYFQLCLLALFPTNARLNHFGDLATRYEASSGNIKREIILAARHGSNSDWLRELKESFGGMDEWCRSAFLIAAKALPSEERRFFAGSVQPRNVYDSLILKWLKAN